jgi:hypothetical protein
MSYILYLKFFVQTNLFINMSDIAASRRPFCLQQPAVRRHDVADPILFSLFPMVCFDPSLFLLVD